MDPAQYQQIIEKSKKASALNAKASISHDEKSYNSSNPSPSPLTLAPPLPSVPAVAQSATKDAQGEEGVVCTRKAVGKDPDRSTEKRPPASRAAQNSPAPRANLAKVVGNWAGSVRQLISENHPAHGGAETVHILDAEVVAVNDDTRRGKWSRLSPKFFLLLVAALAVAISAVGVVCWYALGAGEDALGAGEDELFCGDVVRRDTVGTQSIATESCGDIPRSGSRGAAFRFVGAGLDVRMSTCNTFQAGFSAAYDTRIRVRSEGDVAGGCVAWNDDDAKCGLWGGASTVTFFAERGVAYSIYVDSALTSGGEFELVVTCLEASPLSYTASPAKTPTSAEIYEYKFVTQEMTLAEHLDEAVAWGGALASIHSTDEMDYVFQETGYNMMFLGAKRKQGSAASDGSASAWEWLDGSPWDFTEWESGEPNKVEWLNEDAILFGALWPRGWYDVMSTNKHGAVYKRVIEGTKTKF